MESSWSPAKEPAFPSTLPSTDITSFQTDDKEKHWNGDFTFVQAADTQFGMIDSYALKKKPPTWDKEIFLTKQTIEEINRLKPKPRFFVVCGDLLDSFPYNENGQLELRRKQYEDFVDVFKHLDPEIKLVCVCGNHDIGDDPTPDTVANYRKEFGPDFFSFWCGGVKFVVLNSQYFKSGMHVPQLVKAQEDFMETIADMSATHIVVFQHIPFFVRSHDEDPDYFTVDQPFRKQILDKLYSYGVRHIFCGHYHRNAGGFYKEMQQVVTTAVGCQLGNDKSGYRIVTVGKSQISNIYVELPVQIPEALFKPKCKTVT